MVQKSITKQNKKQKNRNPVSGLLKNIYSLSLSQEMLETCSQVLRKQRQIEEQYPPNDFSISWETQFLASPGSLYSCKGEHKSTGAQKLGFCPTLPHSCFNIWPAHLVLSILKGLPRTTMFENYGNRNPIQEKFRLKNSAGIPVIFENPGFVREVIVSMK